MIEDRLKICCSVNSKYEVIFERTLSLECNCSDVHINLSLEFHDNVPLVKRWAVPPFLPEIPNFSL